MTLPDETLKRLRKKAHTLRPVVIIGSNGLTEPIHLEIERALLDHELIKIKVAANDRDTKRAMIQTICERHEAELIQAIGNVAVIYRKRLE